MKRVVGHLDIMAVPDTATSHVAGDLGQLVGGKPMSAPRPGTSCWSHVDRRMEQSLRIRQYVYFSISSNTLNPDEISHTVGMDCDSAMWRGARLADPP